MDLGLRNEIIQRLSQLPADGAHQVDHIVRVSQLAIRIGQSIGSSQFDLIELVGLCHEIGDRKLTPELTVDKFLSGLDLPMSTDRLQFIVNHLAWSKGPLDETQFSPEELRVIWSVTDADKVEALGAIGVGRTIIYSGAHQVPLFNNQDPRIPCSREDYLRTPSSSVVNHMFEKLLLLPNSCKTKLGTELAIQGKIYMVEYLYQLHQETGIRFPLIGYPIVHPGITVRISTSEIEIHVNYNVSDDILSVLSEKYQPHQIDREQNWIVLSHPSQIPTLNELTDLFLNYPCPRLISMFM